MIDVGYPNRQDIERPNPKDLSSHFLKRTLAALASRIQLPIALIAALLGDTVKNAVLYIINYEVTVSAQLRLHLITIAIATAVKYLDRGSYICRQAGTLRMPGR
jgi:hypothetical protein